MPNRLIISVLSEKQVPDDLKNLLLAISRAGKYVAHAVKHGDLGVSGSENASGENQLALDLLSDKIFCDHLRASNLLAEFASEEQETEILIDKNGAFSVAFDPLDGSSLLDVNFAVGSIFGVYRGQGFLGRTGREMVAAGYFLYGPRTILMLAMNEGMWEFTENAIGEFVLSRDNISVQPETKIFAPGNLRALTERQDYEKLIMQMARIPLTLRYSGGMVPDIHMTFAKGGGIFSYPSYSKYPQGKLRLLFECAPFSYLMEKAGGCGLDEHGQNILDKKITDLHERSTIFIGSKKSVEEAVSALNK